MTLALLVLVITVGLAATVVASCLVAAIPRDNRQAAMYPIILAWAMVVAQAWAVWEKAHGR